MSAQFHTVADDRVFVGENIIQMDIGACEHILKQNWILYDRPFPDFHAAEQDRIVNLSENDAVVGDKAVADGFQVWKSTKAQKGYKKAITTKKTSFKNTKNLKKGVRYFYKVRAYKVVDGKTYYSDWSNKANRIAK